MRNTTRPISQAPNLDELLSLEDGAKWLGMSTRALLDNIRRKKIPAVKLNSRVFRIHPRSVLEAKRTKV